MNAIRCDTCEFQEKMAGNYRCTKTPGVPTVDEFILSVPEFPTWCPRLAANPIDKPDEISHPTHYNRFTIEPVQFLNALTRPLSGPAVPWNGLNVIKYIVRYGVKDGMKDLQKAKQYLDWLIEDEEKEKDNGSN